MNRILLCILACLFSFASIAQIIGTNSQPIDDNRYKDVKGSPYLFDDWEAATIYNKDGKAIEETQINYNAFEKAIEVKVNQGYIELEGRDYPKVCLQKDSSCFRYNFHPKFKGRYALVHFQGVDNRLFSMTNSRVNKRTVNNVGKTIVIQNFANVTTYYLQRGASLKAIKLKRKEILNLFPDKKVSQFVKANQLKLNTVEEVVRVLAFIEE
ncbi:MAG: hypothetical protein AAGI23_15050 [Bacteroidota bacterium]